MDTRITKVMATLYAWPAWKEGNCRVSQHPVMFIEKYDFVSEKVKGEAFRTPSVQEVVDQARAMHEKLKSQRLGHFITARFFGWTPYRWKSRISEIGLSWTSAHQFNKDVKILVDSDAIFGITSD